MIKRDLKQWRKDSDNFIGSSEDRDELFKELEKESSPKNRNKSEGKKDE